MNEFVLLNLAHAAPEAAHEESGAVTGEEAVVSHETVEGTEPATEAEAHEGGLEIQPTTIAFQILNFVLLVVVLHKILYKPMITLLNDREKKIKDGIDNAEKAEGMLKESNQIRQDMIRNANNESQGILEKARKSGEEVRTSLTQDAHKEAEKIIKAGHTLVEAEKSKTAQELKGMAVNLIVGATEKVLREKLDDDKDRNLILESLKA